MKILLAALNAKFIHSSLSVRCLYKYCEDYSDYINYMEFTINNRPDLILREIYKKHPDVLCFSCYIWNIEMILEITSSIKKIIPNIKIILGGPEVSFDCEYFLKTNPQIDIIVRGEGEKPFRELARGFVKQNLNLKHIKGISYRENGRIIENEENSPIALEDLPFVYDDMALLDNRIIYYETQRGCPYNCQYCLSSVDKGVRFLSIKRVKEDLKWFLDKEVKQVKFVDRTFNCNKNHAMEIWKFLIENDNKKTNFHMEISADTIDDEIIKLLSKARDGLFQFEIGVQTTNEETAKAIKREASFEKISAAVNKISTLGNIHQHLDIIAGLPYENYKSFGKSFNDVYNLRPDQLQLGFLKLLRGSGLRGDTVKYGIMFDNKAPYEVLYTADLTFEDLTRLKIIEETIEIYYNSGKLLNTLKYLVSQDKSPFCFYEKLSMYWEKKEFHKTQHYKISLFNIIYEYCMNIKEIDKEILRDLLKFDLFLMENAKNLPEWAESKDIKQKTINFYKDKSNIQKYVPELMGYDSKQISRMCHIEQFDFDVYEYSAANIKIINKTDTYILFDYYSKDAVNGKPLFYKIDL